MGLKGVTDSALSLFDIPFAGIGNPRPDDIAFTVIILLFIIFILLFKEKVFTFCANIFNFLRFPFGRRFGSSAFVLRFHLEVAFLIMLPTAAFVLCRSLPVQWGFFPIMLAIFSFFVIKTLILYGIGYVSGDKETFSVMSKTNYAVFIAGSIIFFLLFLAVTLFGLIPSRFYTIFSISLLILTGLLYLSEVTKIIFIRKVPPFLSILYLCTFEILPVLIIIATISRI